MRELITQDVLHNKTFSSSDSRVRLLVQIDLKKTLFLISFIPKHIKNT